MEEHKSIVAALHAVMADMDPVKKTQQGGLKYKFRGIDQALAALHPLFVKHGVLPVPSVTSAERSDPPEGSKMYHTRLEMNYTFILASDPESEITISAVGEGLDHSDKGVGKAQSVAFKNLCWQLFCVPTEDRVDNDDEDTSAKGDTTVASKSGGTLGSVKKAPRKKKAAAKKELCDEMQKTDAIGLARQVAKSLGVENHLGIVKEAVEAFAPGKKFLEAPASEFKKIIFYIENYGSDDGFDAPVETITADGLKRLHAWANKKQPEGWTAHEWLHAGADLLGHDSLSKIQPDQVKELKAKLLAIETWPDEAPTDLKQRAVFDE